MVSGRSVRLGLLRPSLSFEVLVIHPGFRDFGGGVRCVAALHKEAAESEGTEDQQAFAGAEMACLHQRIVKKPLVLAMAQHVVADDSAE